MDALSANELNPYLERIGMSGRPRADIGGLAAIHRAHSLSIPYENLDVQLGRPVTTGLEHITRKILKEGRGGWCYEMNGLLGAALTSLGFQVTRMAGGVHRASMGDQMIGNHLVLKVRLSGRDYIADVGFGNGLIEPVPLEEGPIRNGFLDCRLERLADGYWRYHNDPRDGAPSFDFRDAAADESLLSEKCAYLQTSPQSPFVQNAVLQFWRPDAHLTLRGRVLKRLTKTGSEERLISNAGEYVSVLRSHFGVDLPEAAGLWPKICARHELIAAEAKASA